MLMHWRCTSTIALGGTGGIYQGCGPLQNNQLTHAMPEQSKLTHCTSTSLEIIASHCLAYLHTATAMKCESRVKLFWLALNRIVILFHPPARRVKIMCLLSTNYIPIEYVALVSQTLFIIYDIIFDCIFCYFYLLGCNYYYYYYYYY